VVCFSSACLSLEHLYDVRCLLGFGEDRVRRSFLPHQVPSRIRHERELARAMEKIRCMKAVDASQAAAH
jgi:hypothetical protein